VAIQITRSVEAPEELITLGSYLSTQKSTQMKIHLKSRQGLFTVVTYGRNSITLCTKHETFSVPSEDFKCFAGGGWAESTAEEQRLFMSVVAPLALQKTMEIEAKITAMASLIDIRDKAKNLASEYISAIAAQEGEDYENTVLNTDDLEDSYEAEMRRQDLARTPEQWYAKIQEKQDETERLRKKLVNIASKVYKSPVDLSDFQNSNGIKFIIQVAHDDETDCRMCFDPYQFVENFHSSISEVYRNSKYFTANGGWLKVIGNDVILYYKSGDYGVYNDTVAIECAKRLFPNKEIHSYAGRQWDSELDNLFTELPF
jgi:hypothetical protein